MNDTKTEAKIIAKWTKRFPSGARNAMDQYRLHESGFFEWFNGEKAKWQEAAWNLTEKQAERIFELKARGYIKD